jgi:pimeloyl-ACP methyl ester carboxylesterase
MTTTLSLGPDSKVKRRLDLCPAAVLSSDGSATKEDAVTRQVLFVQGGGTGTHDEWDDKLVDSLRRELRDGYEVHYPRMPHEDEPGYASWSVAIRGELADLADGAVAVGHSVGGMILVAALAEQPPERELWAIVLVAAPFIGPGGWPGDGFELPGDLGGRLPQGARVLVFHGLGDEIVPPSHAELYAGAIPQAQLHLLPGRDHQLDDDLSDVAREIEGLRRPDWTACRTPQSPVPSRQGPGSEPG